MDVQYIHNGAVIGTQRHNHGTGFEPDEVIPTYLRIPSQHTLNDLLAVQLDPSNYLVRCIADPYIGSPVDVDNLMKKAFRVYVERAHVNHPTFMCWSDTIRWRIREVLVKLGVII